MEKCKKKIDFSKNVHGVSTLREVVRHPRRIIVSLAVIKKKHSSRKLLSLHLAQYVYLCLQMLAIKSLF